MPGLRAKAPSFIRFNQAAVRQAGRVIQQYLDLRLIQGARHASARTTLTGDVVADRAMLATMVDRLRTELPALPEDPICFTRTDALQSQTMRQVTLPALPKSWTKVLAAAGNADLVGIYAAGPICRDFASSLGSRCWHEAEALTSTSACISIATKRSRRATPDSTGEAVPQCEAEVDGARAQLELMSRPARSLAAGRYRSYLAPVAVERS